MCRHLLNQKMNQEEELLADEVGPKYLDYKSRTSQWFPAFKAYRPAFGTWDWQGIRASKEWKTLIWIVALFILLYFREEFYQEKEFFNEPQEIPKHLFFMATLVLLVGVDIFFAAKKKFAARA